MSRNYYHRYRHYCYCCHPLPSVWLSSRHVKYNVDQRTRSSEPLPTSACPDRVWERKRRGRVSLDPKMFCRTKVSHHTLSRKNRIVMGTLEQVTRHREGPYDPRGSHRLDPDDWRRPAETRRSQRISLTPGNDEVLYDSDTRLPTWVPLRTRHRLKPPRGPPVPSFLRRGSWRFPVVVMSSRILFSLATSLSV